MKNLNENIKVIVLVKDFSDYTEEIVDFYQPKYKKTFNEDTVWNSAIICLAFDGDKVVGAVRAISDLSRHALIVDLIVEENFKRQGIGSKLLENIVGELKRMNVANISLATDPKYPWLVEFYEKNGFKPLDGSIYLEC